MHPYPLAVEPEMEELVANYDLARYLLAIANNSVSPMNFYIATKVLGLISCLGIFSCKPRDAATPNPNSHVGGKWHFKGIKEVRAYRINWDDEQSFDKIIDKNGELNRTRLPEDGVVLTQAQIEKLGAAVTGRHPDHPIAACFYPHHAFLFYDDDGAVIGHINVCFLCSNYDGAPKGFAENWDLGALESLIGEIGMPLRNEKWE